MNRATLGVALAVFAAQVRDRPLRLLVSIGAIAVGVALAAAVHLVNGSALAEFGRAARELAGSSDLVVRGTRAGFDEALYPRLARQPSVAAASPVLVREAPLAGGGTLTLEGIDPLAAVEIRPALYGELVPYYVALQAPDAIVLSAGAARSLGRHDGERLEVLGAAGPRSLRIVAVLPERATAARIGYLDIGSLQWLAGDVGRLSRIDLRLRPGLEPARVAAGLALPTGIDAVTPALEETRATNLTRAYRVNLDMLALVALLTGAFLVYATQALAVMRRRRQLALLRALGVRARELRVAVMPEGALTGLVGGILGTALGWLAATLLLRALGGDLGAGLLQSSTVQVVAPAATLGGFVLLGALVAVAGAWVPARAAATIAPARALKAGDDETAPRATRRLLLAGGLLALGAGVALLPPVGGLPLGGYGAIAMLLAAGVLVVPLVVSLALAPLRGVREPIAALVVARLQGAIAQSAVSLAAIVVSFSLMVAMATMVHSFRDSFERWLGDVLPADVYLRLAPGTETWDLGPDVAHRLGTLAGVRRVELRRTLPVSLAPEQPPVTLIARALGQDGAGLPILRRHAPADASLPRAYVSEAMEDLYGLRPGGTVTVPIDGRPVRFAIVGTWRDYARSTGSILVELADFERLSGQRRYTEGSVWVAPGADAEAVRARIVALLGAGDALQVTSVGALRERALAAFDRAFAITYGIEAVAVGIGLLGVVLAFAVQALARRAEFGMLRHLGLRRRDVLRLLAFEGAFMGAVGVAYGCVLGLAISVVLVDVVNRQSFHWTLDYVVPTGSLGAVALALVAAAAATAGFAGRIATSDAVVRAVREDW